MGTSEIFYILQAARDYNQEIGTLEDGVDVVFTPDGGFTIGGFDAPIIGPWVKKTLFPFSDVLKLSKEIKEELRELERIEEIKIRRAAFLN